MNKKTWIPILIALVIVLAAAYLVWWKYYSAPIYKAAPPQQEIEKTVQPETETPVQNFPATEKEGATVIPPVQTTPAPTSVKTAPVVAPAKTYTVNILGFAFNPSSITINKGDIIVWVNKDSVPHTATGSGFDSNTLSNGQSFSFKFNSQGIYNYICSFHPYMKSSVTVK